MPEFKLLAAQMLFAFMVKIIKVLQGQSPIRFRQMICRPALLRPLSRSQDALSISPYAYANNIPIYLCEGGTNSVSSDTLKSIKSKQFKNAIIVGGPIAVDSGVESKLKSAGITNVQRIYGQTEYETSNSIASGACSMG